MNNFDKFMRPANHTDATSSKGINAKNNSSHDSREILEILSNKQVKEISTDQLLRSLKDALGENYELKDTLYQNNLALKHQIKLINQWNQKFAECERKSRQDLEKHTIAIDNLKQLNIVLKSKLQSFDVSLGVNPVFEELNNEINHLNEKLTLFEKQSKIALEERDSVLTTRCKLEADITILKCEISSKSREHDELILQNQQLQNKIKELENNITYQNNYKLHLMNNTEDIRNLHDQLLNCKVVNNSLHDRVTELSSQKSISSDTLDMLNALKEENIKLKNELYECKTRYDNQDLNDHFYQAKVKSLQESHDAETAKVLSYEELVKSKNEEISKLKQDVGKLKAQLGQIKSEGETIAILQAQVEVYQGDFRAEREARESMATEMEKLRDEIKQLHLRNTQLIDDLETYQFKHFNNNRLKLQNETNTTEDRKASQSNLATGIVIKDQSSSNVMQEAAFQDSVEHVFSCPKCNEAFEELYPLEQHVNVCLDQNG